MEKVFKFIGDGDGIPGLPHEVTEAEAKALGAADLLADAIKCGAYVEKGWPKPAPKPAPKREEKE